MNIKMGLEGGLMAKRNREFRRCTVAVRRSSLPARENAFVHLGMDLRAKALQPLSALVRKRSSEYDDVVEFSS